MKQLLFILSIFVVIGCSKEVVPKEEIMPTKTVNFNYLWSEVSSDKLEKLPENKISFGKLFTWSKNIILDDAKRTLENHNDLLEPFDKLAHPNGICLKGTWSIDKQNIYSGYFKKGSKALIVARASTAMSTTKVGEIRAFGFAGKLFPTLNKKENIKAHTANFFLIDDLGGTDAPSYRSVELTNEPSITTTSAVVKNILYAVKVAKAFADADKNPNIRQLYEISQLGEKSKNIITPKWMMIKSRDNKNIDALDFRDELKIATSTGLTFDIFVSSKSVNGKKDWENIGTMKFEESVVSNTCDHRLHFHHPKFRDDLKYN